MSLFPASLLEPLVLINTGGQVVYYGTIMDNEMATAYFNSLLASIEWKQDEALIYGKLIHTKRMVAWFGDEAFSYTYSQRTRHALPWTDDLRQLKVLVESKSGETFNACLLNLYHDGSEGMAWHSDGERDLKEHGAIASLSFGAVRKFSFKNKHNNEIISIPLEHGSLLMMLGETQKNWLHRLPPTKMLHGPRINLTFRTIDKA